MNQWMRDLALSFSSLLFPYLTWLLKLKKKKSIFWCKNIVMHEKYTLLQTTSKPTNTSKKISVPKNHHSFTSSFSWSTFTFNAPFLKTSLYYLPLKIRFSVSWDLAEKFRSTSRFYSVIICRNTFHGYCVSDQRPCSSTFVDQTKSSHCCLVEILLLNFFLMSI